VRLAGRVTLRAGLMAAAVLAVGCVRLGPRPAVKAYVDSQVFPDRVRTVLILPLANETPDAAAAQGLTTALYQALQARRGLRVTLAPPTAPGDETGGLDPRRALTLKDLARIRTASGCDALVVGSVTHCHPYPRMQLGLYLRMLDLRDGRVVWAVDHIWDATDKATERRIEQYFREQRGSGYEPVQWHLATMSPAAFQQFVACETAATLGAETEDP